MPKLRETELRLSIRILDRQVLLKREKECIHDTLLGEDLQVEGDFFIFNIPCVKMNETIHF